MNVGITSNKILKHLDRAYGNKAPITADIFLDNYCNNKCDYCTYARWELDKEARYMKFEDFKRYADRLIELGVLGFILTGGGEPSISKDFEKIITWLDDNELKWGINTNFNKYFFGKPQYLKVSLDAYSEESYMNLRGVFAYEEVRDNIIKFASEKSVKTSLGIQLLAKDISDVSNFYNANKSLPVDYIVIRPVESTDGKYYSKELMWRKTPDAIIKAVEMLRKNDERVVLNYKWNMLDEKFDSCTGQWSQIALNELGEVMYCCHKPYQIIGHIMDEDILEKKEKALTDMHMCDVPCRLTSVNYNLNKINEPQLNAEFI